MKSKYSYIIHNSVVNIIAVCRIIQSTYCRTCKFSIRQPTLIGPLFLLMCSTRGVRWTSSFFSCKPNDECLSSNQRNKLVFLKTQKVTLTFDAIVFYQAQFCPMIGPQMRYSFCYYCFFVLRFKFWFDLGPILCRIIDETGLIYLTISGSSDRPLQDILSLFFIVNFHYIVPEFRFFGRMVCHPGRWLPSTRFDLV